MELIYNARVQFLYFRNEASDGGAHVGGSDRVDDPLLALGQPAGQIAPLQIGPVHQNDVIRQRVVRWHAADQLLQQNLPRLPFNKNLN